MPAHSGTAESFPMSAETCRKTTDKAISPGCLFHRVINLSGPIRENVAQQAAVTSLDERSENLLIGGRPPAVSKRRNAPGRRVCDEEADEAAEESAWPATKAPTPGSVPTGPPPTAVIIVSWSVPPVPPAVEYSKEPCAS